MATRVLDGKTNFGKARVQADYNFNSTTTTVVLETGDGADLPAPATDGDFNLTVFNATDYSDSHDDPNREIVRVTARSTDTLTITRGQEGTTGKNHNTSGKTYLMILGVTKKDIDDIDDKINEIGDVAFRVNISSDQSIPNNSETLVQFNTVDFDETTAFDTTNYKFTATRAMLVDVTIQLHYTAAVADTVLDCILKKNTTTISQKRLRAHSTDGLSASLADKVKLANTDYLQVFAYQNTGAARNIYSLSSYTFWSLTEFKKL